MKINQNFILRQVAGEAILIPSGQAALDVQGLIRLSESGAFLYELLAAAPRTEEELVTALLDAYEGVSRAEAAEDVRVFAEQMRTLSIVED